MKRGATPAERVRDETVTLANGCRPWLSGTTDDGYGKLVIDGHTVLVHRFVWVQENGEIPADMVLDHRCRNRLCCALDHLRLVTPAENTAYGIEARLREQEAYSQGRLTLDSDLAGTVRGDELDQAA